MISYDECILVRLRRSEHGMPSMRAQRTAFRQMREAGFWYRQYQARRKMHDPVDPVGDEFLQTYRKGGNPGQCN
jgi:hypothetical protein